MEWSNVTSKKARKKKVAAITKTANPDSEKKKKKSSKKKKSKKNNKIKEEEYDEEEYHLTDTQYRIKHQIAQTLPPYKYDHILPKIITKLNMTYFDPKDEKLKIQILDCLVSELQQSMVPNKGNKRNKKQNKKNKTHQKQEKQNKKMPKKSGKFRDFMNCVGSQFLEYIDNETMSTLVRIKLFSFIKNKKILTPKQRLIAYTAPNDIVYRLKSFNTKLNTLSSLKLYELRKAQKTMSTTKLIYIIICNGLLLENRFKAKFQNQHFVAMDLSKNNVAMDLEHKVLKQFNVWNVTNITDLNKAYLDEFGFYQRVKNGQNARDQINVDGKMYLNDLNDLILDKSILSKENIKSLNCAYIKVIRNYELQSFLWMFIELKPNHLKNKKDIKQFMVWMGMTGSVSLTMPNTNNNNKF